MNGKRSARAFLLVTAMTLGMQIAIAQPSSAQSPNMGTGMIGPGGNQGMGPGMMGGQAGYGYGMGYGMMGPGGYGGMGYGMMGPGMHSGMGYGMMGPGMHGGMGYGMMGPGMHGGMMSPGMFGGLGYGIDARFDHVKSLLGITDAQKGAWEDYVKVAKARFDAMQTMHSAMFSAWQKGTPEARLDARISGMEAMLQNLKAQKPALNALYKALSDEQKKKANYLLASGWGMM